MKKMISVIFATHNGEKTLPIMLDAFSKLELPENNWEILAVDNASTDQTASIIKSYSKKLPILYLYEKKTGKNNALNLAIPAAKGELFVFTDDDIIPETTWLIELEKCAHNNPEYDIFGGTIKAYWPKELELWIAETVPLGITYALTEPERPEGKIFPGLVWGPNMAIRKSVFDASFRFDCSVGPNGKNYVMGSETEFTIRLGKAGHQSWFCKKAVVQHIIRKYQLEPSWIIKRAYRFGRNMYQQESKNYDSKITLLFGIPRWMYSKLLQQHFNFIIAFCKRDKKNKLIHAWEIQYIWGYIKESNN